MTPKQTMNSFSKGMIKDVADNFKPKESYEDALDIRLNSNGSDSEYTVTNVKGTEFSFTVPDVPNIVTITADDSLTTWVTHHPVLETSTGVYTGAVITTGGDADDLFDAIENALKTDPVFAGLNLNVARIGQRIRVWSTTEDVLAYDPTSSLTDTSLQNSQLNQTIIGWDNINDDIYLFTTNDSTATGGIGAIWKLTYDQVSLIPVTSLVYSEAVNFTTQQPIANPGGIESIYETPDIQRSYWTDRINSLRTINLADPNVMAVLPENLSFKISVIMRQPKLQSVQEGGSLMTGMYQVSYGLRTEGGAVTPYSQASNGIPIVEDGIQNGYRLYRGNDNGVETSKSFTVEIKNIDTSFTYLDIIVIRKESEDASPLIQKVAEIPITGETMTYTHTGSETAANLTEDIFTRLTAIFDRCHTIAQKDNILFAANTTTEPFDIDFDARAYRFNNTSQCVLEDSSGNPTTYTLSQLTNLPEDDDAINPDQDTYRFQADGVTIGGEGPNVKYRFNQRSLLTDIKDINDSTFNWRYPWTSGDFEIDLGEGNVFHAGDKWDDFKSPYTHHALRGYRREETYRFSLVPVKDGREGYAKWIADIKMPAIYEEGFAGGSGLGPDNYQLMTWYDDRWSVNTLGVVFSVSVPTELKGEIDGFKIKRVKLEPEDRTVLAQGIMHLSRVDWTTAPYTYHPIHNETGAGNGSTMNDNDADVWAAGQTWRVCSFHSPDFLFGKPVSYKPGDKLKVVSGLSMTRDSTLFTDIPGYNTEWYKIFNECPIAGDPVYMPNAEFDINDAQNIGAGESITLDGISYKNTTKPNSGLNATISLGTDTTVLAFNGSIPQVVGVDIGNSGVDFSNADPTRADKMLANYVRVNEGQYGGKDYSARSRNVYINTGSEIIFDDTNFYEVEVYGGDTFVNVFDSLKMLRNFAYQPSIASELRASALFYPVESNVNTDLREGYTMNNDLGPMDGMYGSGSGIPDPAEYPLDYGEDFKYNYLFSEEMDTQRSFPKPIGVTDVLDHPVRIWASGVKVYGERADSWRMFDSEKYIDIQGDLGEIRQLMNVNERLLAWQKRGFGMASVNERSILNDQSGNGIIIGKSGVLPRFDYISQIAGAYHQFGFGRSSRGVLFFDGKDGSIYLYSGDGLKDITQDRMKNWLYDNTRNSILSNDHVVQTDSIWEGIAFTYDDRNNEFLMTFHSNVKKTQKSFTLAYDDTKDSFISFRTIAPAVYINDRNRIFMPSKTLSTLNDVHMHDEGNRGEFFGADPTTSYITITANPDFAISKVNDNLKWHTEVRSSTGVDISDETFSSIELWNSYQQGGVRTDFTRLLREWRHSIKYEENTKNRLRDMYCKQRFSFLNNNDKEIILHYIINNYRLFNQ